jgi:hypothetical protein
MDFMGPTWTRETKKALIFKGFLYVFELCWIINWWRRRESNPRPKTFHSGVYIHSPTKDFHLLGLAGHGGQEINL